MQPDFASELIPDVRIRETMRPDFASELIPDVRTGAADVTLDMARPPAEVTSAPQSALDVDGKVRDIERQIGRLDADRRVRQLEGRLSAELPRLTTAISAIR